jgi:hypothetical protein
MIGFGKATIVIFTQEPSIALRFLRYMDHQVVFSKNFPVSVPTGITQLPTSGKLLTRLDVSDSVLP